MLHILTLLEETPTHQELVVIGEKKGCKEGDLVILSKWRHWWFGELPDGAVARLGRTDMEQLESWAERIFDVADLAELLGSGRNRRSITNFTRIAGRNCLCP